MTVTQMRAHLKCHTKKEPVMRFGILGFHEQSCTMICIFSAKSVDALRFPSSAARKSFKAHSRCHSVVGCCAAHHPAARRAGFGDPLRFIGGLLITEHQ